MDIRGYLESRKLSEVLTKELSRREVEILSLYASGFSAKEISDVLIISENTVRTHIGNIISKIEIPQDANPKITLCLLYHLFRQEIMKMGGYTNGK
jgi:DNA-binding NarL/FixJ family response regulator